MVFVLASVALWFFLLLLSALWWKRLRGLCKLLDERDCVGKNWVLLWWAGPCSVKLWFNYLQMGRVCSLPGSFLAWGDPSLGVKGDLQNRTFPDSCYQSPRPCGGPLWTHTSTADPPTLAGSFGSVSCRITAPFFWVLVHTRFCLWPLRLESLFPPALWKSYNQIPLVFKVGFPADSQSLCQVARLGSLMWGSEHSQQWKNFFGTIGLQFVSPPLSGYGFWFIVVVPLLPSQCSFFFAFGHGVSFLLVPGSSCG